MKLTTSSQNSDRDLVLISVFTFFTVTLWIFFEILKTIKTTTVTPEITQTIAPLSPKIDVDTIEMLEEKKLF
jgi:hypothetical protein